MKEVLAIVGIGLISGISVLVFSSLVDDSYNSGMLAYNGYSSNKVYGGAQKKVFQNPQMVSQAFEEEFAIMKVQEFLYANRDKWDCSFGEEAKKSAYPCVFDDFVGKYCCVVTSEKGNFKRVPMI